MTVKPIVVGLGELLWDCFPNSRRAGGAPANFAFHARQLGLGGVVCSRVGSDPLGDEIIAYLEAHGLSTDYVQRDAEHATGRVDISLSPEGEPSYDFLQNSAWDHLAFDAAARQLASQAAVVCFGTLAQRDAISREAINAFLDNTPDDCLRVFDINIRTLWFSKEVIAPSLERATMVKLNEDEVHELSRMFSWGEGDAHTLANRLYEFSVRDVIVTRGPDGCLLFQDTEHVELPGLPVENPQPVGAGDAFTAAVVNGKLHGLDLPTTAALASRVAALVASHEGAMPDGSHSVRAILADLQL